MKNYYGWSQNLNAAVICGLLAMLLVTACGNTTAPSVAEEAATPTATATASPTASPTAIPPTATATATPSPTRQPATSTPAPTASPTASATPTATPVPPTPEPTRILLRQDDLQIYETTLPLVTYPFREYLIEQLDPTYNMPVYYFNRPAYEAAAPEPEVIAYGAVILENPHLRLTFLPELGGRLYSAVIKATGQEIFYHNPVVKPSRYGGLQPPEANWWLATGGMEWAYPTQEHGYRFGVPWEYSVTQDGGAATITLSDTGAGRVGLAVAVSLPADGAAFSVAPRLINDTAKPVPVQLWVNAALALSDGSMSPNTRFVIPTEVITIHSRGEAGWNIPDARVQVAWPEAGLTDLSNYSRWANYLGFFVSNQDAPFIGAFNPGARLGIVRLPQTGPDSASGKLFAFSRSFSDRSYTDDDSQYFEIWGGVNSGFWPDDDLTVPPGETLSWQEQWWPLAGLRGITWANEAVAIDLIQTEQRYTLTALVSQPTSGQVQVLANNSPILAEAFDAAPGTPLRWEFTPDQQPLSIEFTDSQNTPLLVYQTD